MIAPANAREKAWMDAAESRVASVRSKVLGRVIRIRTGKNSTVTGEIVDVTPGGFRRTRASIVQLYRVTLECGSIRYRETFLLSEIPVGVSR